MKPVGRRDGPLMIAALTALAATAFLGLAHTFRHGEMIRTNQVLSLAPEYRAILERARTMAWRLIVLDLSAVGLLSAQL